MKSVRILLGLVCACFLFGCNAPSQQETQVNEEKNAVIETIMTRRSVRKYQPQAVNRDTMQIIMDCGINAPNAINRQAWEVRIVDNPEVIQKLTDLYLKNNPNANITINGYASPEGTEEYNQALSQRRADAVKNILVNKYGIAATRINAIGHGVGAIFSEPAWNRVGICTIDETN